MIGLSALVLIGFLIYAVIIIFQIFKDDGYSHKETTKLILKSFGFVALICIVPSLVLSGIGYLIGYVIDGNHGAEIGNDIGYIFFGISFIIFCFYRAYLAWKNKK